MAKFTPPFAWNGERRSTTPDEQEFGIPCGPFDRKMWNQLFRNTQAELGNLITASGQADSEADLQQAAKAIQSGKLNYATAGGTANALTATLNPVPTLLPYSIIVKFTVTNTGPATIKVNGLNAVPIVRYGGAALQPGDLVNGSVGHLLLNNAGQYQLISIPAAMGGIQSFLKGTSTFIVPGVYVIRRVRAWSGAGGGGGSYGASAAGSGGGAGAYAEKLNIPVIPGQSIPIVVGGGGIGGGGQPTDGTAGGATSFGSVFTIPGGGPGIAGNNGRATSAGAGAIAPSGVDVAANGVGGGLGVPLGGTYVGGGNGGSVPFGGGITPLNVTAPGQQGLFPGGGGGGGVSGYGGGNGSDGFMIVEW